MVERICHVCGAPAEPGAQRCVNCGTSLEPAREPARPSGGKSSSSVATLVGVAVVIGGGAAAAFFTISMDTKKDSEETRTATEPVEESRSEADEARPAQPPETQQEVEALEQLRRAQEALRGAAPDEQVPSEEVPPEEPAVSGESVILQFGARVISAKGKSLSKGKKCDLNVHAQGSRIVDLDVSCGDVVLYDSRTPLNGMASVGGDLFERAKGDGWIYRVAYADTGMRTSRSQVRLNSLEKKGTAFSEGSDAFQVELALDEFSAQRTGPSLLRTLPAPQGLALNLHLRDKSGEPPALNEESCKLTATYIETSSRGAVCKTELRCGKQTLYGKGQSGFGPCEFEGVTITRFVDESETHEDGDPRLVVDMTEGSAELRDSPSHKDYSLTFEVAK